MWKYDYNYNILNQTTFNYDKNELIEAYQINEDGKYLDITSNEELVNSILSSISINNPIITMNKEEINKLIESIKKQLSTSIKLIKGDIPLQGLSKLLDITLSKINSKKEIQEKQSISKKEQSKTKKKTRKK